MAPGTNLTRGSERMKNRHTEGLVRGRLGSLMVRSQHPTRSACLLHTVEQKDRVIAYSWKRRCGYDTQTNKESGFMVYNWFMERGLAYIGSLWSSIGKQFWGSNYPRSAGKKAMVNFLAYYVNIMTVTTKGFAMMWSLPCQQHTFTQDFWLSELPPLPRAKDAGLFFCFFFFHMYFIF